MLDEKYIEKNKKLFATLMVLEKTCDRVDMERHLLEGIQSFDKDASASVHVKGKLSGSVGVGVQNP